MDVQGRRRRLEEHALKADHAAQLALLHVQDVDSHLMASRHELANLPQTAELRRLAAERDAVAVQAGQMRVRVDDLTREQRKADADVEQVRGRRRRDRDRMDRGEIANPKDLQHMQQELVSLERRITELEDLELEVMEQLETAQADAAELTARVAALNVQGSGLLRERDARAAEIAADIERLEGERREAVSGQPSDLMALYDRLREQKGGVGAAPLRARQCGGCSLQLDSAAIADIARQPSDEVVRCEECGRILVRTPESGL